MTDEALHFLARALVRFCSPRRAHSLLVRIGAFLPSHGDRAGLFRAGRRLQRKGTCLTRSLAIAARSPRADLVIGVLPPGDRSLFAHAWLELDGVPVDASDVAGEEIVRLRSTVRRPRRVECAVE